MIVSAETHLLKIDKKNFANNKMLTRLYFTPLTAEFNFNQRQYNNPMCGAVLYSSNDSVDVWITSFDPILL